MCLQTISDMLNVYILNMLLLGIFGSVNKYMGMVTVGLPTACLLHTQTSE